MSLGISITKRILLAWDLSEIRSEPPCSVRIHLPGVAGRSLPKEERHHQRHSTEYTQKERQLLSYVLLSETKRNIGTLRMIPCSSTPPDLIE